MDWSTVEQIRINQENARRANERVLLSQSQIQEVVDSQAGKAFHVKNMTETAEMVMKLQTQLIDFIIEHGLVKGFIFDEVRQQIQGGDIVITADMIKQVTDKLGLTNSEDAKIIIDQFLKDNFYVSDRDYVHTDNNYTDEDKAKLDELEPNKVIDVIFNGDSVLDPDTRIATITITPEMVKDWYEQNANTNAFTDELLTKLSAIPIDAEPNRVNDVIVDDRSVMNAYKQAIITKEGIKEAYEKNPNTNAYTDADKAFLDNMEKVWRPAINATISSIIVNHRNDIHRIDGELDHLEEDIGANRNAITALGEKIEAEQMIQDERIRVNEEDIAKNKATISAIIKAGNEEIKTLSQAIAENRKDIDDINIDIANINLDMIEDRKEFNRLININASAIKLNSQTISSLTKTHEDDIIKIWEAIEAGEGETGEIEERLNAAEKTISAVQLTASSIQAQHREDINRIDTELGGINEELGQQMADITGMKQDIEDNDARIMANEADIAKRVIFSRRYLFDDTYDFNVFNEEPGFFRLGASSSNTRPLNMPVGADLSDGNVMNVIANSDTAFMFAAGYAKPNLYYKQGSRAKWAERINYEVILSQADKLSYNTIASNRPLNQIIIYEANNKETILSAFINDYSGFVKDGIGNAVWEVDLSDFMSRHKCMSWYGNNYISNRIHCAQVMYQEGDNIIVREMGVFGFDGTTRIKFSIVGREVVAGLKPCEFSVVLPTRFMTKEEAGWAGDPYLLE